MPSAIPPAAPDFAAASEDDAEHEERPATQVVAESPKARECAATPGTVNTDPDLSAVRARIDTLMRWGSTPSVAVAVAYRGQVLWEEGFGFADKARRVRATARTAYSIASVSKPLTATAIMLLVARGEVSLDTPINDYLGEVGVRAGVGDPADATIARVASHTAGLPLHYRFYYEGGPRPPSYEQTRQEHALLVNAPGERYRYSNLGFGLLEQVIARVSGQSYESFMQRELFDPLGMHDTAVGQPAPRRGQTVAVRYDDRQRPIPDYRFDHDGASAIYSSAHDLVSFAMAHMGHRVGTGEAVVTPAMLERMVQIEAPSKTYGLGWGVGRVDGHVRVSHSGGMPGVRTLLLMVPGHDLAVAVLTNGPVGNSHRRLAQHIVDAFGVVPRADAICALAPGDPWLGRFEGTLDGPGGQRPFTLTVDRQGMITGTLDGAPAWLLRGVSLNDDGLRGESFGDLGAPAAAGKGSDVEVELQRRGDRLTGSVSATVSWTAATTFFADLRRVD